MNTFSSPSTILKQMLKELIQTLYDIDEDYNFQIYPTKHQIAGDYQTNICFVLSKNMHISPLKIAEHICDNVSIKLSRYADVKHSGKGFLVFNINENIIINFLHAIHSGHIFTKNGKIKLDNPLSSKKRKVIIDYSSPNIAKQMHVGHLRSTIIGDALGNILEYIGHNVLRINHIGDWGTQFGILINYIKTNSINIFNIKDAAQILSLYKKSSLLKNDELFMNKSKAEVVLLQSGDAENIKIWKHVCMISLKDFQNIYSILNIKINTKGESFYNNMLPSLVKNALKKKCATHTNGAVCIFSKKIVNSEGKMIPFIIRKRDGGFGYAATDLAALKYRVFHEEADWIIYVTDDGQELHFKQLFNSGLQYIGKPIENIKLDHVSFGSVCNEEGKKIQTRSGNTANLSSLLDQAKAQAFIVTKNQSTMNSLSNDEIKLISDCLAVGAVKFSDLICHRKSSYIFNFKRMFQIQGKSSIFINYTFVRIQSILFQSKVVANNAFTIVWNTFSFEEIMVAKRIFSFIEILEETVRTLAPHIIAVYAYNLSSDVNLFLEKCKILGSNDEETRIYILTIAKNVIEKSMSLLNIPLVTKM